MGEAAEEEAEEPQTLVTLRELAAVAAPKLLVAAAVAAAVPHAGL